MYALRYGLKEKKMNKFDELVNDYTLIGDDGAVIFSSYDQFLEFVEEIRQMEREACAKIVEADGLARGNEGLVFIKAAMRIRARGEK